jgi:hypothetical protein
MPHRPASPSVAAPRPGGRDEAAAESPRVQLARAALEAALALPDVVEADAGPHGVRVTADRVRGALRGVSVTADGEGRYAVDLRLVARMVPLVPLAEEIRERVRLRAGREGLKEELGLVNVEFGRLVTDEEVVAEAVRAAEEAVAAAPPPGEVEIPPPGGVEIPPPGALERPPPSDLEPPPTGLAPPPTDPAPPPAVPPAPATPPPPVPPDRGGGP